MSTGDESDDEDLTDADTSDGDWSDNGESETLKPKLLFNFLLDGVDGEAKSLLGQYHRFTNHYNSRYLTSPSLWEESPFVLTHVRLSHVSCCWMLNALLGFGL